MGSTASRVAATIDALSEGTRLFLCPKFPLIRRPTNGGDGLSDEGAKHYKQALDRWKAKYDELTSMLDTLRKGNRILVARTHAQEREIAQLKKANHSLAEIDAGVRAVQEVHISRLENALLMIFDRSDDAEIREVALMAAQSIYQEVTDGMVKEVADALSGVSAAVTGQGHDDGLDRGKQPRRNRPAGGRSAT